VWLQSIILEASKRFKVLILAEWPVDLVKRQYMSLYFSPECLVQINEKLARTSGHLNTRYPVEDHNWLVDSKYVLVSGSCILPLQTDHLPKIAALRAHKIESER
jgi:hypothetical protein